MKCTKRTAFYCEELIKYSLFAACNAILGQSAASKMKDIPFPDDAVERLICDMAERCRNVIP